MKYVAWTLVLVLVVLHQDNWLWDDHSLVWGMLPTSLVYHMGISVAASVVWLWACRFAWPIEEDDPHDPLQGDSR